MQTVKTTKNGIDYLTSYLKKGSRVVSKVFLWKIPHKSSEIEDICLKIGRYKFNDFATEIPETETPKSELTLDKEEFDSLITFLTENYEPFRQGVKKFISVDGEVDPELVDTVREFFKHDDKKKVIDFISTHDLMTDDLIAGLESKKRLRALSKFKEMLSENLLEHDWQTWFTENNWILGSEFVKILDEREIDTANITDYLMQAYDGFMDIIEIKRPSPELDFWSKNVDHGNYIPSTNLIRAITQATKYIFEVEQEANSVKFYERTNNVKAVKPRCVLIYGRSSEWNDEQKEAYRILNTSYHNLTILTYDHVFARAQRILGQEIEPLLNTNVTETEIDDIPF